MMTKLKSVVLDNWIAKLVSLAIAMSVWYLTKTNLPPEKEVFPVPGVEEVKEPVPPTNFLNLNPVPGL
jgi:hypothetical protein